MTAMPNNIYTFRLITFTRSNIYIYLHGQSSQPFTWSIYYPLFNKYTVIFRTLLTTNGFNKANFHLRGIGGETKLVC